MCQSAWQCRAIPSLLIEYSFTVFANAAAWVYTPLLLEHTWILIRRWVEWWVLCLLALLDLRWVCMYFLYWCFLLIIWRSLLFIVCNQIILAMAISHCEEPVLILCSAKYWALVVNICYWMSFCCRKNHMLLYCGKGARHTLVLSRGWCANSIP